MDQFDGHPGTAKLAQVLDKRTSQKTESPFENEHIPGADPEGRLHDLQAGCRIDTFNLGTELAWQIAVGRSSS